MRSNRLIKTFISLGIIFSLFKISYGQNIPLNGKREFSINIKSKALVLGPKITLGEIGVLAIPDSVKKEQLASVELGLAPPPGESREITLRYIKRCIKRAGFGEFISYIKGPRTIRVITAPVEIDKAILKDEIAQLSGDNKNNELFFTVFLESFLYFAYFINENYLSITINI